MNIGLLIIGTELLNGHTSDQNINCLATLLLKNHQKIKKVIIVEDKALEITQGIEELKSNDLIITSGGLGPTKDDVTKKVIADHLGLKIRESKQALELVLKHYTQFNKNYLKDKFEYHFIPKEVSLLYNSKGLAPGLKWQDVKGYPTILSFPGVPKEFKEMAKTYVLKELECLMSGMNKTSVSTNQYLLSIRTVGLPEEKIFFELVPQLEQALSAYGDVASLPHNTGVDINISISYSGKDQLNSIIEQIDSYLKSTPLYQHIWHQGQESLEKLVLEKLKALNLTISTAESCTGGLISSSFTDIPGSSQVYMGGICSYDNSVKMNILGISESLLNQFGAVSKECAEKMAEGAMKLFKTDLAISTTGIAGPGGGSAEKPVGLVYISLFVKNKLFDTKMYYRRGERLSLKEQFKTLAFHLVWEYLKDTSSLSKR